MSQNPRAVHLASIAHDGRLWDAYMEQEGEEAGHGMLRARVRFTSPEADKIYRTAAIIIEASWEEAVRRAQAFGDRQLAALLRSVLPDSDDARGPAKGAPEAKRE
jgi:hypothetical protein